MKTTAINTRLKALFDDITLPGDFRAPSFCATHQLRQALITDGSKSFMLLVTGINKNNTYR